MSLQTYTIATMPLADKYPDIINAPTQMQYAKRLEWDTKLPQNLATMYWT